MTLVLRCKSQHRTSGYPWLGATEVLCGELGAGRRERRASDAPWTAPALASGADRPVLGRGQMNDV